MKERSGITNEDSFDLIIRQGLFGLNDSESGIKSQIAQEKHIFNLIIKHSHVFISNFSIESGLIWNFPVNYTEESLVFHQTTHDHSLVFIDSISSIIKNKASEDDQILRMSKGKVGILFTQEIKYGVNKLMASKGGLFIAKDLTNKLGRLKFLLNEIKKFRNVWV